MWLKSIIRATCRVAEDLALHRVLRKGARIPSGVMVEFVKVCRKRGQQMTNQIQFSTVDFKCTPSNVQQVNQLIAQTTYRGLNV